MRKLNELQLTTQQTLQEKLISPPLLALPGKGRCSLNIETCDRQLRRSSVWKKDEKANRLIDYPSTFSIDEKKDLDTTH